MPKTFAIVVVMALVLLVRKSECGNGKNFNSRGSFSICCIDINHPHGGMKSSCSSISVSKSPIVRGSGSDSNGAVSCSSHSP